MSRPGEVLGNTVPRLGDAIMSKVLTPVSELELYNERRDLIEKLIDTPEPTSTHCFKCGSLYIMFEWNRECDMACCDKNGCTRWRNPNPMPKGSSERAGIMSRIRDIDKKLHEETDVPGSSARINLDNARKKIGAKKRTSKSNLKEKKKYITV